METPKNVKNLIHMNNNSGIFEQVGISPHAMRFISESW